MSRILSVCFAVVIYIIFAYAVRAADENSAAAAPCTTAAEVTRITPTDEGLFVETSAAVSPRIEIGRNPEQMFTAYSEIQIDIPNASSKAPLVAELTRGPFIAVRGVRYRTETECGVRLRLTSKIVANWRTERVEGGFVISAGIAEASKNGAAAMLSGEPEETNGGSLGYRLTHSVSDLGGDTHTFDSAQIGFAQRLDGRGTLRGFFSDFHPRRFTAAPYGALGIAGAPVGNTHVDVAAGDLAAVWGTTGLASTSAINTMIFRGAGANVLLPRNYSLIGWHGRAAASIFSQLRSGERVTGISHDHITGLQGAWSDPLDRYGFGIGWARSSYREDGHQDNFVQSLEARWHGGNDSLRSTLEESRGGEGSGAAFTLEPKVNTKDLSLNGFLRYFSRNFRPPLGSNYFATLRRSYGLSAAYHPNERLAIAANLSQAKTFQLYDPENAGTLSESESVSVTYLLTERSGVSAFHSESNLKSDPGALLQADSHTRSDGVGAFTSWQRMTADLRVSRDETVNRREDRLDLRETVVEGDVSYAGNLTDVLGHVRVANVSQSADNAEGYRDFTANVSADRQISDRVALHAEAGHSERPPGTTLLGFREDHLTIGIRTGPHYSPFNGTLQVGYSRASSGSRPSRSGWIVTAGLGDLLHWGHDRTHPLPPFDSRAMNVQQTSRRAHVATLAIDVFFDTNQNGVHDPGEEGVPRAQLDVDSLAVHTGRSGIAGLLVRPGEHTIRIQPSGAMLDYYIANEKATVAVRQEERREISFPLQPAGRVAGRVILSGELTDVTNLSSIRITLKGGTVDLSAVTEADGTFTIGLVPAGTYTVSVDTTSLVPEVAVDGPSEISLEVKPGAREEVKFTLRKATARERYGIPPRNRNSAQSQ